MEWTILPFLFAKTAMSFNNIIRLDSGNNERNTKGDTKEFGGIVNRLHGFYNGWVKLEFDSVRMSIYCW